jgi:hypothetical protein
VQRSHQAGEFNDIAYNHLVCRHGHVFEGRGFGVQTGANGTGETNQDYAAVVYMAGAKDSDGVYTRAGMDALGAIIREWQAKGAGPEVRTHGSITGSSCPGPVLTRWVASGGYHAPDVPDARAKRLEVLRAWIQRNLPKLGWTRIKKTANWREFKRLGGK